MDNFLILTIVVVLFSTVQSLFGVGLLVFGTPTLLLLGYPFESTIAVLLPASITISLMQVLAGKRYIGHLKKDILVYGVPFIVLGLTLVLTVRAVDMKLFVGIMLVGTVLLRCHETTQNFLSKWLERRGKLFIMAMGLIHGLSNMGGGLLTLLVTSTYQEKDAIRANIAFGYMIFAAAQLIVLGFLNPNAFSIDSLIFSVISLLIYATAGHLLYLKSSKETYQKMVTLLVLFYGVILIVQQFM